MGIAPPIVVISTDDHRKLSDLLHIHMYFQPREAQCEFLVIFCVFKH